MTKEERAEMSRKNGAKSKGPVSEEGKSKSRMNALKDGEYAKTLAHYIPVHDAVMCTEDRDQYRGTVDQFIAIYKPANQEALNIIRDMATARWQIERLKAHMTALWNLSFVDNAQKPNKLLPELHEMQTMALSITELLSGPSPLSKLNREITRLQRALAQNERRLKFCNENFPTMAPDAKEIEKEEVTVDSEGEIDGNEPPIYITENVPHVIAAYRIEFPGRKIIILPPEKNEYNYDDMPVAPRKAA